MKIPVRALLAAAACLAIAWVWRFTGERQEVTARRALVGRLLDEGRMNLAQRQAESLAAEFAGVAANDQLLATTKTLLEANALLKQRRPADARARLAPVVVQPDAPAAAHYLLSIALNQLGEPAAAAAERAKARELAPDAPLFRDAAPKGPAGDG